MPIVDPGQGLAESLGVEDLRLARPLGTEDRRLALALGGQDRRLLGALGDVDLGLPAALRLGDHGAACPLRGELPVHRILDVAGRRDLADLDGRHLAAPSLGDLVELGAQDLVDLLAAGEDLVEEDVADDGAQRGRGHTLQGTGEVGDVHDALERVDDPPVDEEVDVDRGVVAGDRRLAGDLDELLPHVHLHRPVDDRDEKAQPRVAHEALVRPPQPEDDHLLVLLDHPDREVQEEQDEKDDRHHPGDRDAELHCAGSFRLLRWMGWSGGRAGGRLDVQGEAILADDSDGDAAWDRAASRRCVRSTPRRPPGPSRPDRSAGRPCRPGPRPAATPPGWGSARGGGSGRSRR